MHKNLILLAYKKAKDARKKLGDNKPSSVKISEDLSDYIDELTHLKLNEKTYRTYYSEAKKIIEGENDINISQLKIVYGLCKYLDYEDYEDFIKKTQLIDTSKKESTFNNKGKMDTVSIWIKKEKIIIAFGILIFAFFIVKTSLDKQRWMIWEKDHFTEVQFNSENYDQNILKIYNKERILKFKKIISSDCKTPFLTTKEKQSFGIGKKPMKK
jgi:hypothetical protein